MATPGGDKLHATPEQLRAAGATANAKADEIDQLVQRTNQRVDQMEATWEGLVVGAFDPQQQSWTTNMTQLTTELRRVAGALIGSAGVQDQADADSQRALASVPAPTLNLPR